MTADSLLLDRLQNYLTRHMDMDGERLQSAFGWPLQFVVLRESFPSFDWLCADTQPQRMFGIRHLIHQAPFRLSDLRARGFRTESLRHPVRPPVKGSVEHYLITELLPPHAAVIYLCMYTQSKDWVLLDEHRIRQDV